MSLVRPSRPPLRFVAGVALALLLAAGAAAADPVQPAPLAAESHLATRVLLATGTTVTGEPIRYPFGTAPRISAVEITVQPGQQTGWHTHPVPLVAYILEGELTVDYGAKGKRTYRKGDAFVEAMDEAHNGHNAGPEPVRLIAVILGAGGLQASLPASPPGR
jgi:quercetin dioxygenase-like cupin family protein